MNVRRRLALASVCLVWAACSAGRPVGSAASVQLVLRQGASLRSTPSWSAASTGKNAVIDSISMPGSSSASVCSAGDEVVFSCPLAKGSKSVSMCASRTDANAAPIFYYAFGHSGAPELRFPASGHADNAAFSRTHLGFVGNTGGYAYSFANAGYRYIVYSVSGSERPRDGGVIVQPSDKSKAATKLACRSTAITETSDDSLIDATLHLKKDPQIQSSGLPETTQASPTLSIE